MKIQIILSIICILIPLAKSSEQLEEISVTTEAGKPENISITIKTETSNSEIENDSIVNEKSALRNLLLELNQAIYDSKAVPSSTTFNGDTTMVGFSSNILDSSTITLGSPRPKCEVSKAKVESLKEAVDRALQNITAFDEPASCDYSSSLDADKCSEIFKLIQCGMSHLTQAYLESLDNKKSSFEKFQRLQNALDQLQEQHRKEINDLKSSMAAEYLTKLENLQKRFNTLSLRLKETLEKLKNANFELCIYHIYNENPSKAGELFNTQIDDTQKLKEIIQNAYQMVPSGTTDSYKRLENFDRIEKFISHIDSAYNRLVGCDWLAKILKDNGHLDGNNNIIKLRFKFDEALEHYKYDYEPLHLSENFPDPIDTMFWSKYSTPSLIRNEYYDKYLYVSGTETLLEAREKTDEPGFNLRFYSEWARDYSFSLNIIAKDQVICVSGGQSFFWDTRNSYFIFRSDSCNWYLTPMKNSTMFTIRNVKYGKYISMDYNGVKLSSVADTWEIIP